MPLKTKVIFTLASLSLSPSLSFSLSLFLNVSCIVSELHWDTNRSE